jgi:glycosyltransferase involved in cell wall biosynthesis
MFTRVQIDNGKFPFENLHTPGGLLARFAYRATTYSRYFARTMRERNVRLVHAHFGTSAVYAHTFHRLLDLPMIVTFHGYDVGMLVGTSKYNPRYWRYWAMANTIFKRASLLLCASEELRAIVSRLSGRPEATRLYQLGIDLSRFNAGAVRSTPARVMMVGRFIEKKGHLDGIEAFAEVIRRGIDARLVIVGDGELAPAYHAAIAKHGIQDRVEFPGVLPHKGVAELLATSTAMLAPCKIARDGDRDSGILVAKEAGAAGLPVVGTQVAGLPEIIDHGETGFLVAPGDVPALADKLYELLRDPTRAERMGKAARAKMEREYDLRVRVGKLEDFYDEVSDARPQQNLALAS